MNGDTRGGTGRLATLIALLAVAGCRTSGALPANGNPAIESSLDSAGPEVTGWEETGVDGTSCRHPAVEADCTGGFCRVPAGCFIMGSPETGLHRGRATERLTAVTLTRAFLIRQFEVTREEWREIAPMLPEKPPAVQDTLASCTEPGCPVRYVTWFEALAYANTRSERSKPPLAACYELTGCQGSLGRGMTCTEVASRTPNVLDCEGFRLPTEAEWEYAARAGTRTAFYSGQLTQADYSGPEPNLEPIAWYANNAASRTHPGGGKKANRWGLFDVLGNVWEWTSDRATFSDPPGPLVDPATDLAVSAPLAEDMRVTKGGAASMGPSSERAAGRDYPPSSSAASCTDCAVLGSSGLRVARGGYFSASAPSLLNSARDASSASSAGSSMGMRCARTP